MGVVFWRSGSAAADYSAIDSPEKARGLVRQGGLVPLLMLPELFGGDDRAQNVVYVPADVADRKTEIDEDVILPLIQAGARVEYSVDPEYDGRCSVPIALNVRAHEGGDPIVYRLAIWGKGLSPAQR